MSKRVTATPDRLKPGVGLIDVVTLGAGAAVGVALFSIFAPAAQLAGAGMLISMALAAVPMIIFAVVYAFMGSALPVSGASFSWPTRFIHPFVGFLISWLRILGSVGAMVVVARVLIDYASMVVALPATLTMFVIFTLLGLLNLLGITVAARAQTILFGLLTVVLSVLVVGGVTHTRTSNLLPLLPHGWIGLLAAVPVLVSLFLGIETAVEVGEEIRDARKTIVAGIAVCVGVTLLIYFAVSVVCLGTLGPDATAASHAPLLDAARKIFGPIAVPFIVTAAVLAMLKSLNVVLIIFSRFLFAMGRAGALPAALARIHPRWGTPYVAVSAAYGFCLAGLYLPDSLVFLFLAVNIPTMLKYLSACICALRIADLPEVYERAAFKPSRPALRAWSIAGIVSAIGIVAAGFGADWRPYAVLGVWGGLGAVYWVTTEGLR